MKAATVTNTLTVTTEEYELLHAIFLGALEVRDQGVQPFNRLPSKMRLAVTTLAAHYREQGYGDRGLPDKAQVSAMFSLGRPVSDRGAFTPVTGDSISDGQILDLWRIGAIDTQERDRATRPARKPHHVAWRTEARQRCAAVFNARGGK